MRSLLSLTFPGTGNKLVVAWASLVTIWELLALGPRLQLIRELWIFRDLFTQPIFCYLEVFHHILVAVPDSTNYHLWPFKTLTKLLAGALLILVADCVVLTPDSLSEGFK